jgi:predicted TIM-barrel fold metal-dependent hydrolase
MTVETSPLTCVDVDLHHQIADWKVVASYVPEGLRWRVLRPAGPPMARHGYKAVGIAPTQGRATDPARVKAEYLEPNGIDRAILTGSLLALGVQPNPDLSAAIATGVNDWTLATWVRPYDCYKGSILVAQQDPAQAVAEIDRLGGDPGMVQVLMCSAGETPLGRRQYHPIYEACVRHDLPLALHMGGEGAGTSSPASAVGHPSTYVEWYADLPQSYMAHLVSLVSEGVFEKFPTLKIVLYEGGVSWLPHVMWRFDKNWKAQHGEIPWVTRPPSEYILEHVYSTTYPLERLPRAGMQSIFEIVQAEHTLLYAGNFPNQEYGEPREMLADLPEDLRPRVMVENALAVYGERLLAPNR